MKIHLLLLCFGLVPILFAQNEKLLGVEYFASEQKKGSEFHEFIGFSKNNVLTYQTKLVVINGIKFKFKLKLFKWDENFDNVIQSFDMKLSDSRFKVDHIAPGKGILFGSKILHFFTSVDKSNKRQECVFVSEYDVKDLSYLGTKVLKSSLRQKKERIEFELFYDERDPKTICLAIQSSVDKNTTELEIIQIDEDLKSIFRNTSQYEKEKEDKSTDFQIDGDWIYYVQESKAEKNKISQWVVHAMNITTNKKYKYSCKLENTSASIVNLGVRKKKDDSFLVYGFYSLEKSQKSENATMGLFSQVIDFQDVQNLKNEDQHNMDLSFEENVRSRTVRHLENLKMRLKSGTDGFKFIVEDVVRHEDGSFTIVAESQRDSWVNSTSFSHTHSSITEERTSTKVFVNMDIFYFKISKEGNIIGVKHYERFSIAADPYMGKIKTIVTSQFIYSLHFDNGDFYLVQYNPKNEEVKSELMKYWGEEDNKSIPQIFMAKNIQKNVIHLPVSRFFKWKNLTLIFPK